MTPYEVVNRIAELTSKALLKNQKIDGVYCVTDHGQMPEEVFQVEYAWLYEGEQIADEDVISGDFNEGDLKRVILIN